LADYAFSTGTESNGEGSSGEKNTDRELQPDPGLEVRSCEPFCVSEETDGNNSEKGELVKECYAVILGDVICNCDVSVCIQVGLLNGKMKSC